MATYGRIALVFLFVLLIGTTARADAIVLKCEHLSGAFRGAIWAVQVDLATGRLVFEDHAPVVASVSDRYIQWEAPKNKGGGHRRIDRATGQWTEWSNGRWDTVFGQPGIACTKAPGIF